MSRRKDLIHSMAFCQDCDWEEGWYKTAARMASDHSRKTGHTVRVEQGYHYTVKNKKNDN